MKLKHIIILQNKIDLVKEAQAVEQHEQIIRFVQGLSRPVDSCPLTPIRHRGRGRTHYPHLSPAQVQH